MRRWLPSHLRRFPLKYKTWLASAESINPKRDRLVESHLSKNERWANRLIGKAAPAQSLHLRGTGARLRGRRPTVSDEGTEADGPKVRMGRSPMALMGRTNHASSGIT